MPIVASAYPLRSASRFGKGFTLPRRNNEAADRQNAPAVTLAADRNRYAVGLAFYRMVTESKSQIRLADLEEVIPQGAGAILRVMNLETRMERISQGAGLAAKETSFYEALQKTFRDGAQAAMEELEKVPVHKASVGASMVFDLLSPEAIAFLTGYNYRLIREVSNETRAAISDVIVNAFQHGGHPREQARYIRSMIGLTRNQVRAVENFRRMLESGNSTVMEEALTRALRDKRFDATVLRHIQDGSRLPQASVDTMVDRYYQRYLKYRAENIARTETIRASAQGQKEVWRQATQQGLLDKEKTRRKWIVSHDERTCPRCKPIPGLNPDGVGLDEEFRTEDGTVAAPPLHPSCRCSVGLSFIRN